MEDETAVIDPQTEPINGQAGTSLAGESGLDPSRHSKKVMKAKAAGKGRGGHKPKGKPQSGESAKAPKKSGKAPRKAPRKGTKAASDLERELAIRDAAGLLKQAADPTRLAILLILSDQERNVTELCGLLGKQSQPAVSHHLALLRAGRLAEPRRAGKNNVYSLTDGGTKLAATIWSMLEG